MGLFNLFKKKETQQQAKEQLAEKSDTTAEEHQPYLGDLAKTTLLFELLATPQLERDEIWQTTFLDNIGQASFRCGDPQVVTGLDGFPYFQLFLPEPGKSFQCYVIEKMKDDFLINAGFGIVINPSSNHADWVLSYGDILNFHLNHTFYTTDDNPFSKELDNETIKKDENVMVGQPSENILPKETRQLLAAYLKENGIPEPKILLMIRGANETDTKITQDLVFNVTPNDFDNEDTYRNVMGTIAWFLPRHYSYVGMHEKAFTASFMPL